MISVILSQFTAAIITLAALAASIGVLCQLKPVRWLWNTLVTQPVLRAFQREVKEIIVPLDTKVDTLTQKVNRIDAELHPNDGRSLRDAVDKVVTKVVEGDGSDAGTNAPGASGPS